MSKQAFKALLEEYIELKEANKRLSEQVASFQKVIAKSIDVSKPKIDLYEVNKNHTANLVIGSAVPMWGVQPPGANGPSEPPCDYEYDTGRPIPNTRIKRDDSANWG